MSEHLFLRTTIAIIWDFDTTLVPGYMQEPLFRRFKVDGNQFWKEANALSQFYRERGVTRASKDTLYLNHILAYVRAGRFGGLNNQVLRELGSEIEFYPGLPDFFPRIKDRIAKNSRFSKHQINVEHYVVSTGLREMIMGSRIAPMWMMSGHANSPKPPQSRVIWKNLKVFLTKVLVSSAKSRIHSTTLQNSRNL